ncbi:Uncharacterised protein [uncultured archaeon]|nr:Uncharacterised protein [uncultured archaeon]
MSSYEFYRVKGTAKEPVVEPAGTARFEEGKGVVVESDDRQLTQLLTRPLTIKPTGETGPYTIQPTDKRFLEAASIELWDAGYLGKRKIEK